jgi:hypothetical protein
MRLPRVSSFTRSISAVLDNRALNIWARCVEAFVSEATSIVGAEPAEGAATGLTEAAAAVEPSEEAGLTPALILPSCWSEALSRVNSRCL